MLFKELLLSQQTVEQLSAKSGVLVSDEDTLCFAIKDILNKNERLSQCVDELMSDLMKKKN